MNRLPALLAAGLLAGGAVALSTTPASADWPMSRHDAQRTGFAKGKGNIVTPMPTWRFPLGGALDPLAVIVGDADGDQKPELFFLRGAEADGKRIDDTTMWKTAPMGINNLVALADLDGDGQPELIAGVGANRIAVIDSHSGAIDWLESSADLGYRSIALVGDLDGDGVADLLVQDCGCCGALGAIPGAAFTFKAGAKSPKMLWQLPHAVCGAASATTLWDADGDGRLDVLLSRNDGFDLLDGATGQVKASLDTAQNLHTASCSPARLPGGGQQLVCVFAAGTTDDSGHQAFALGYQPGPTPALAILWQQKVGTVDGRIADIPGQVADLDGDGQMEVTVTAATSATTWSTYVLDAATGTILSTIDGHKAIGTAPVLAGQRSLILTEETGGFAAWSWKRTPSPAAAMAWQMMGQKPLVYRDLRLSTRQWQGQAMLALDLTGDGTPDLVTSDTGDGSIRVLDANAPGAPKVAGSMAPPGPGALTWAGPASLDGKPVLATAWNDGLFRLHWLQGGMLIQAAPPGVHYGGCYSQSGWAGLSTTPVVAKLDGPAESVIVSDCATTLHRIDAAKADANTPPVDAWALPNTTAPVVVNGLSGASPGVAAVQRQAGPTSANKWQVVGLTGNAKPLWSSPLDGSIWVDLVAGKLDGDGVADVLVQWNTAADSYTLVHPRAISGATGATLLEAPTLVNWHQSGAALHDFDGDGIDDIYNERAGLQVFSGATGQLIGPPPAEATNSGMPIIADVDGDGAPEVVLQAGDALVTVLSSDLTKVLWSSNAMHTTWEYGALAYCPAGVRLLEGTYPFETAQLTITDLSPPNLGNVATMVLAGGQKFPDAASATAAGAFAGQLSAINVHENITGLGHPTAVFGSTDGWLYGIDACSGDVDFAYDFGASVGAAVFGDTDGDGIDEILVEVADGYLYDVKQKVDMPGGAGGTGGSGGSGGFGGFGGSGGFGGLGGSGGSGGGKAPYNDWITGRATCFCATPGERGGDGMLAILLAAGLSAASFARRGRRRA